MKDINGKEIDVSEFTSRSLEELREKQDKLNRFESKVTAYEGQAGEYVKQFKEVKEVNFDSLLSSTEKLVKRPQKEQKQVIEYEAAKVLFWKICKERIREQERYLKPEKRKGFVVDEHNKEVIINLIKYFIHDESGAYNLNKGILLTGDVGTGKTLMLSNFAALAQILNFKTFRTSVCNELYDDLLESNYKKKQGVNLKRFFKGHWSFDEIGDEEASFQHYGNVIRPMDRIFSERYKNWENGWCLTHGTTNLDSGELFEKYGKRVHSRMKKMFNIILLGGGDRRG
jgi:hypothetical protein